MSVLCVRLLGSVELSLNRQRLKLPASCRPLLAYLCINHLVSRQEIAGSLWADIDEQRARHCLSTALWRLKSTPGLDRDLVQSAGPDEIGLVSSRALWIDVEAFEARAVRWHGAAPENLSARSRHELDRAVSHYRGDFLPQSDDDWALLERQRLRTLYLDTLYQLTASYAHVKDYPRAIDFGRRLAAVEPLREDVHRILMHAYVSNGNRGKAIEQYRICEGELGSELGIAPMPETQAVFRQIVEPDTVGTTTPANRFAASLNTAAEHVRWIRRTLRRSDEQLAEALALIERAGAVTSTR